MEDQNQWNRIARHLSEENSPEEEADFQQWLEEDEKHMQLFQQSKKGWEHVGKSPFYFDAERGRSLLASKLNDLQEGDLSKSKKIHRPASRQIDFQPLMIKVAAAVLLLVVAIYVFMAFPEFAPQASDQWITKVAKPGTKFTFELPDGSLVKLNAGSELKYPPDFGEEERKVFLKGEGFFEVVKDANKPFRVMTNNVQTEVLGTAFNVRAYADEPTIEVGVSEGKVAVSHQGEDSVRHVTLVRDTKAIFDPAHADILWKRPFDVESELAWKDGKIVFDQTTMETVAKTLERWYDLDINVGNDAVRKCQITGEFKNETFENVLESLRYTNDIDFEINGRSVVLKGKGCASL